MPQIVDAYDLAPRLKVSPQTVLAWARRGWIPSLRAGQRPVLFDVDEVVAALKKRAEPKAVAHAAAC